MVTKSFKYPFLILVYLFLMSFASCVSMKKYEDLEDRNMDLKNQVLNLKNTQEKYKMVQDEKSQIEDQLEQTEELLKDMNAKYNGIQKNYEKLQQDYNSLTSKNMQILNTTAGEKSELENQLAEKQRLLDEKAKELKLQESNLEKQSDDLDILKSEVDKREKQIAELNENLMAQRTMLQSVKSSISEALAGFTDAELQVEQKANGKVYVSLSQDLLFKKGSSSIDTKGRDAIKKLANVLNDNPEIDILVEGHTDIDGTAERNWDLSVTRATEVVKILQSNGVDPKRLTASGKAFYLPVAPNDTEENKSKNRRTEIILSPKLNKLYELIQNQ